jgi:pyrimidine operon attenuation protein/uracil phosphoribosyltransferase
MKTILSQPQIALTIKRLTQQVLENHMHLENTVLIGLQPRGVFVSNKMVEEMKQAKIIYSVGLIAPPGGGPVTGTLTHTVS